MEWILLIYRLQWWLGWLPYLICGSIKCNLQLLDRTISLDSEAGFQRKYQMKFHCSGAPIGAVTVWPHHLSPSLQHPTFTFTASMECSITGRRVSPTFTELMGERKKELLFSDNQCSDCPNQQLWYRWREYPPIFNCTTKYFTSYLLSWIFLAISVSDKHAGCQKHRAQSCLNWALNFYCWRWWYPLLKSKIPFSLKQDTWSCMKIEYRAISASFSNLTYLCSKLYGMCFVWPCQRLSVKGTELKMSELGTKLLSFSFHNLNLFSKHYSMCFVWPRQQLSVSNLLPWK